MLFGDLPYIEYESPTASPRPFIFEEGMLLDRPPRSIHGMSVDPVSSLGALVLEWTTGPNVFNLVPFDDTSAFEGEQFNQPWVADSKRVAWSDHPVVDGWKVKDLSVGDGEQVPGYHPVSLVHLPGTWAPGTGSASFKLDGEGLPWFYVLDGTGRIGLEVDGEIQKVDLEPGSWVRWQGQGELQLEQDWTDDIGVTLLTVGGRLVSAS